MGGCLVLDFVLDMTFESVYSLLISMRVWLFAVSLGMPGLVFIFKIMVDCVHNIMHRSE